MFGDIPGSVSVIFWVEDGIEMESLDVREVSDRCRCRGVNYKVVVYYRNTP